MSITAFDMIKDRGFPITTSMNTSVVDALGLMHQHEYSQLPVINPDKKQQGIITGESILKTQRKLGAPLDKLRVQHAAMNSGKSAPDDNIFDVFELFHKHSAVLVVDSDETLMGIITPWDAAAHLQQRTEDLMLIADIEGAVKEHLLASFTDKSTGILSQKSLDAAIVAMNDNREKNTKLISGALAKYFAKAEIKHRVDQDLVRDAFDKLINSSRPDISFEKLTLNQYIELLLNNDRWGVYGKTFSLEPEYLRNLLFEVRDIRNRLAHFRDEITQDERGTLRYCRDLFERHPVPNFALALVPYSTNINNPLGTDFKPLEEELSPGESRYARLALYLQQIPMKDLQVDLAFEDIEGIIEGELPSSAWQHRSWWANDTVSHVQSQQWLDAGWRVGRVNLTDRKVTFVRSQERNQMYIKFFSELLNGLRGESELELRDANPIGVSWVNIANLPRNGKRHPASLNFAFTRGDRFRVELYIDTGDADKNKLIFDSLYNSKLDIEAEIGERLEWEKLITKRASRIAIYTVGSIEDDEIKLAALREWAIDRMRRFAKAISTKTEHAIHNIL